MKQEDFLKLFKGNMLFCAGDDKKRSEEKYDKYDWKENINQEDFKKLNKDKFGIYFTVNKFTKGSRRKDKIKRIRAVFCEDDYTGKLVEDWPLPPSIVVCSSPGKYHYYWLTNTTNFKQYELVMQTMVDKHNCDNHARDISRVLRIPGLYHNKSKKFRIKVIGGNKKKYKWDVITFAFPPASKKKSNYTSNSAGDFDLSKAVEELTSTNDLHGSMISIAMSMANKNVDKETFNQFMGLAYDKIDFSNLDSKRQSDVASRFGSVHLDECYDSAIEKIEGEEPKAKKIIHNRARMNSIPKLPKNLMEDWPEPWPLIWKEWCKIPRTLEKELLLPTILSAHAYILNSTCLTEWDRRPNMAFLGIAMSTANKDINSKNVLRTIDEILKKKKLLNNPFSHMATGSESISSDTAFLKSFSEIGNLFWLNTEATHIFQQMAQAGTSNSSVKALESKIIDVVDGQEIMGKTKAGEKVKSVKNPNCQILLYTQPETISSYLKTNIIDSGLLGRMIITVHESNSDPFENVFIRKEKEQKRLNSKLVKMYERSPSKKEELSYLFPDDEGLRILTDWMKTDVKSKAGRDDSSIKVLKRLEITAEQLYTLVLGISRLYGNDEDSFCPSVLLPLLNYWADCKMYAIREYINSSADPLSEAVIDVIKELISGHRKVQAGYKKTVQEYNAVPAGEIIRFVSGRKRLLRDLEGSNDKKNVTERILRILNNFVRVGILVEIEIERKRVKFYGFPEDSH